MKTDESQIHRVHPRWVWGGMVVALLGGAVLALGISLLWMTISIVGAAILIVGALIALAGGIMNDARNGLAAQEEMRQVVHGDVHEGVSAGDMIGDSVAHEDAARTADQTRMVLRHANAKVQVPLAPLAGWLMFALAWIVALSQPWLIGHTATGGTTAARDAGLAILVGLSGFRIATAQGLARVAVLIAFLAGVGLVLGGVFADHSGRGIPIVETAYGVFTILAVVAAALSPTPPRRR